MTKNNIKVAPDSTVLVAEVTEWIKNILTSAIEQRGQAYIALAGGGTPKMVYQALGNSDLPWDKLQVFWGDERFVPPNDPDSNELMARQNWLDLVAIPPANIHPWPTQSGQPEQCAELYQAAILECFDVLAGQIPQFDLILLGIGEDGHTASLFPYTAALRVNDQLTTVGDKDGQPRLTLTVPMINQARYVAFMIAGANKQAALQQIWSDTADEQQYPAKLIKPNGELWWWIDAAASQFLS
jgi:6-phosphogluconolactonase